MKKTLHGEITKLSKSNTGHEKEKVSQAMCENESQNLLWDKAPSLFRWNELQFNPSFETDLQKVVANSSVLQEITSYNSMQKSEKMPLKTHVEQSPERCTNSCVALRTSGSLDLLSFSTYNKDGWIQIRLAPRELSLNFTSLNLKGVWFNLWNMPRLHNTGLEPCKIECLISKA